MTIENTLSIIKPDATKRNLIGAINAKLEQAGLGEGGGITTVRQQGYRFSIDNI